jgi:hypothetical protein
MTAVLLNHCVAKDHVDLADIEGIVDTQETLAQQELLEILVQQEQLDQEDLAVLAQLEIQEQQDLRELKVYKDFKG